LHQEQAALRAEFAQCNAAPPLERGTSVIRQRCRTDAFNRHLGAVPADQLPYEQLLLAKQMQLAEQYDPGQIGLADANLQYQALRVELNSRLQAERRDQQRANAASAAAWGAIMPHSTNCFAAGYSVNCTSY
jgi:hypothetical protein